MDCCFSAPKGLREYPPVVKFSTQVPLIAVEKRTVEMKCIFSGKLVHTFLTKICFLKMLSDRNTIIWCVRLMPGYISVKQDSLRQDSLKHRLSYRAFGFELSCARNGARLTETREQAIVPHWSNAPWKIMTNQNHFRSNFSYFLMIRPLYGTYSQITWYSPVPVVTNSRKQLNIFVDGDIHNVTCSI